MKLRYISAQNTKSMKYLIISQNKLLRDYAKITCEEYIIE